mmetsp:Transcript_28177/g.79074  ORF Transcript_28177/g.79074 Transcript_28177/m.79074 type:complete len:153 (-) Transcript_28177:445-903(-)
MLMLLLRIATATHSFTKNNHNNSMLAIGLLAPTTRWMQLPMIAVAVAVTFQNTTDSSRSQDILAGGRQFFEEEGNLLELLHRAGDGDNDENENKHDMIATTSIRRGRDMIPSVIDKAATFQLLNIRGEESFIRCLHMRGIVGQPLQALPAHV